MDNIVTPDVTKTRRRILIIDNHPLVRRGLSALIENEPDLTVCAESTHQKGLEAIAASRPDLVITDLWLAEADGFGLIAEIRARHADQPILVLSMYAAPRYARRALDAGANGYVSKQEMGETLLIAIRCVLDGEVCVSPKMRPWLDSG
jgi:DNA-binding NarL/FixJ family response regulator